MKDLERRMTNVENEATDLEDTSSMPPPSKSMKQKWQVYPVAEEDLDSVPLSKKRNELREAKKSQKAAEIARMNEIAKQLFQF